MFFILFTVSWAASQLICWSQGKVWSMGWFQSNEVWGSYPQSMRKGEARVVSLGNTAAAKSANGNSPDQLSWWWLIKGCIQFTMCWLMISVCPSVWVWCVVDNFSWILSILQNSFQKSEMNWGPQLDTIVLGGPWCWYTCSTNNWAIPAASIVLWQGILMGCLLSQSTITRAASYPHLSLRNVQKSMKICCQGHSGTGKGFNSPGILSWGFVAHLHLVQFCTYHSMSLLQVGQ